MVEMARQSFAPVDGYWLKGNLHAHSTVSDGDLPPEQVLAGYRERGYDFFSLTDHNIYARYHREDLILIPGFELTCHLNGKRAHINFYQKGEKSLFFDGEEFSVTDDAATRRFIERAQDDYLIMLNHPDWSRLEYRDVEDYDCFFALEVLNYGTEYHDRVGENAYFWDAGLRNGKKWWGLATDDNHNGYTTSPGWPFDHLECDSFGGWVMVKAQERSHTAIIEALEAGHFYASGGPEIYDFSVENGIVHVSCSPVRRIVFKGEEGNFVRKLGENLTEFTAPLRRNKRYVRVECIDEAGRIAYSNPIYL
jgi:hypothetical protein